MGKMTFSMTDYSVEPTTVGVRTADLSGDITTNIAEFNTLLTAIEGISLIDIGKRVLNAIDSDISVPLPTDKNAQREKKWLVRGIDGNGNAQSMTVGGADLSLLQLNSDFMDLTNPAAIAFINAVQAVWESNAGSPVTVSTIKFVGRTL